MKKTIYYLNVLEYADHEYGNNSSRTFMNAAGGAQGADVFKTAQKVLKKGIYQAIIPSEDGISWMQLGEQLQRGTEIIGSMSLGENTFHAVNILNIKVADKLTFFGEKVISRSLIETFIRDPLGGVFKQGPTSFRRTTWINYGEKIYF